MTCIVKCMKKYASERKGKENKPLMDHPMAVFSDGHRSNTGSASPQTGGSGVQKSGSVDEETNAGADHGIIGVKVVHARHPISIRE